jgi:Zn-dependent alcohol dehydrogenase
MIRGIVDRVGDEVTTLAPGDKVVVSFQTACGTCRYCQKKLSSFCERTNNSSLMASMYGQRDAGESLLFYYLGMRDWRLILGFFGYGHMYACCKNIWDELISGLEVYQVVNLNMSEFHSERSTV